MDRQIETGNEAEEERKMLERKFRCDGSNAVTTQ